MDLETLTPVHYSVALTGPEFRKSGLERAYRNMFSELADRLGFNIFSCPDGVQAEMGKKAGGTTEVFKCNLKPGFLSIVQENPSFLLDEFWESGEAVLKSCFQHLEVPLFAKQQFVIRKTANPAGTKDARSYLATGVCGLSKDELSALGPHIQGVGLRFVVPIPQEQRELNIKVESLLRNPEKLFIEVAGAALAPVTRDQVDQVQKNLYKVDEYLSNEVYRFLSQFPRKPSAD